MNGQMDPIMAARVLSGAELSQAERDSAEIRSRMAPPGGLKLASLLDKRRLEHGITDSAFKHQASFERVFVWQLPMIEGDFAGSGSKILMPETTKSREKFGAPRGILISAGLRAQDIMYSHGIEIGHIVTFIRVAPFHFRYDRINGKDHHLIILNVGDICGSDDLATELRDERVITVRSPEGEHHLEYQDERPITKPLSVYAEED